MSVSDGDSEELRSYFLTPASGLLKPTDGVLEEPSEQVVVEPTDRLFVPHHKRMYHAYVTSESGAKEICLQYGVKEVTFDEERLFPFGEQLVKQTSFIAEAATTWGPGYEWSEIRGAQTMKIKTKTRAGRACSPVLDRGCA